MPRQLPGDGRVALVTGAATGIGQATTRLLSQHGFHTFGTSRTPVNQPGSPVEMLPLDVCDEAAVRHCIDTLLAATGRIDVLINNVGGGIAGAVEETSVAEAQAVFEVNLWGAVRMTQAALPIMRAQGNGRVIVMSFAAALVGIPFRAAYCASKFALESIFEALRVELTQTGVHVSIIKPGGVATPAANHVPRAAASLDTYRDAREGLTQLFDSAMRNGMPPERVARVILHAATVGNPRARYLVGGMARAIYLGQRLTPTAIADATMTHLLKHNSKGR